MTGPSDTTRSLLKNGVSQIGGRLGLSLGRLGAALLIVHLLSPEAFGEYALVLNFVVLFEWLCDFGQTDISVRTICREPEREGVVLAALGRLKLVQGVVLGAALPLLLLAMAYPAAIVRAGAVGGASLVFYALAQVYRTRFKVRMCMERDVLAELGGLVAMLPLTYAACRAGAGVATLVGCYTLARVVFLGLLAAFGRDAAGPRARPGAGLGREMGALLREAAPLGVTGLLVSAYDILATVMLSKMADLHAVAAYAAATRFVFPTIIVVQALASAFYPPLSALWGVAPARFAALQQAQLQASLVVGGGLFCGIFGGAGFLMHLMGPSIGAAAPVLQIMSVVVLARSVTAVMSPLFVVAGWQRMAAWLTLLLVAIQLVVQLLVVPRHGIVGAAMGYLAVDVLVCMAPVAWLGQRVAQVRLRWGLPARLLGSAGAAVALASATPLAGSIWGGFLAGLLFVGLSVATGGFSLGQARAILADLSASRAERGTLPRAAA